MNTNTSETLVNAEELLIILNGGLARLPRMKDKALWANTRLVAEMLKVTPQSISQLCFTEGLPKHDRDRFYIPDVLNWKKVKVFAELTESNPKDFAQHGLVDFSLGGEDVPELSEKILQKIRPSKTRP